MAPRTGTLQVSRPLLFRPFTSVTTPAQDTKTPSFEFAIPRLDDTFVLLTDVNWPTTRFVYVFLDKLLFPDPSTFDGIVARAVFGDSAAPNVLAAVIRVEPNGQQSLCFGIQFKAALAQGSATPFQTLAKGAEAPMLEPEAFGDDLKRSYAVAAPIELPLAAIDALEANRPSVLPPLGTGMGIGVTGPVTETPANPDWVFPVVDPILIAEHLTRQFFEAADNFLAASNQFERPKARDDQERKARTEGEVLRLKKTVADNLLALRSAAPSLSAAFADNIVNGQPDSFIGEYKQAVQELAFQRELAAFRLIAWLESDLFKLADDWWDRKGGKPDPNYEHYLKATLGGLARLIESDRGVKYLMELRERVEQGSSPVPPGVLHVTSAFIFPPAKATTEQAQLAAKTITAVFGVWAGFVAAGLAVRQRVVKGPNPTTTLVEDMKGFAARINFVVTDDVIALVVDDIPFEMTIPGGIKKSVVDIPTPSFVLGKGAVAALQKTKDLTDHVTRVCAIVNFGLAYAALRAMLQEGGDPTAETMAMSDLVGASFGVVDQAVALPALTSFRNKIAGKINMGGALLGNRAAGAFGLLGAVASLTTASLATAQEFDRGDWDEALAHMTEGVGALLTGVGSTVILVSGATGPFALWSIGIGATLSTAGFIWSVFAADTEIDQMLKFSAFGTQAGQAALQPPGWSLCQASFAEWNPKTAAGLLLQLRAFQQIFYAFEASGAESSAQGPLAADGILRLTPASLRLASSFEIDYIAFYSPFGNPPGTSPVTRQGKARVIIPGAASDAPVFADLNGNYATAGAIRVHKDGGRDAIDVLFRLSQPLTTPNGTPFELVSLTCGIQQRLPGLNTVPNASDDTLVVPTTAKGVQSVVLGAVKDGEVIVNPPAASVKVA